MIPAGIMGSAAPGVRARRAVRPATGLPDMAREWLRLGEKAAAAGQRADARYYFVQAVRNNTDDARAWLYLGGVAEDPALTLSCMQKALQLEPGNADARAGLHWARSRLGLLAPPPAGSVPPAPPPAFAAAAATLAPEPMVRPPDTSLTLVQRGINAANDGDRSRARYYFLRAASLDSTNLRAWLYLGGVANDPAFTLAALERVLESEPYNRNAYAGVLWARNKLGLTMVGPHPWQS